MTARRSPGTPYRARVGRPASPLPGASEGARLLRAWLDQELRRPQALAHLAAGLGIRPSSLRAWARGERVPGAVEAARLAREAAVPVDAWGRP